ncbi:uncharacterized protein LOC128159220 [Crassostrea angulata]|uniref:uncharacterized protein LOC128159220 n=1 Tax=Magallana angulata TaxID=2784310 RepID=UPI0022B0D1BB|nr:uncharacterized protein LOC128159220 [Crassostrea angulata]
MKLFLIISRLSVCLEAGAIALQGYPSSVFRQAVEMNNVLPEITPLFDKNLPLLQCLITCIVFPSCLSVFASKQGETCKGCQFSHRHKTGLHFLHIEGEIYYAKVHECTTPGYIWNPTHLYCYKYHAVGKTCDDASSECRKEDSRSHLFLVDSNNALSFLQNIIDIYQQPLYLQGKRQNENSQFFDDFGKIMTFFNWTEGEPKSIIDALYIRTINRFSALIEVSKGNFKRHFMCFIM